MTNDICGALGRAIRAEFGDEYLIYDEEVKQGLRTPCFFVGCGESREKQYTGGRFLSENRFVIRYLPKDGNRKRHECEEVSQRLFNCLLWLETKDGLLMGRKMSGGYEKGELSFYVNYDFFAVRKEDKPIMGEITERVTPRG